MRRDRELAGDSIAVECSELMGLQSHRQALDGHMGDRLSEVILDELRVLAICGRDVHLRDVDNDQRG